MAIDREKILHTAQKLVDKKKYDKAVVEYEKLVAQDPGDVRTLLKIGDLHLKRDAHEDAIEVYERVGEFYYREGFSVKAIAVYKQIRGIIRRHAKHLEGRYGHIIPRLAEIYTQLGLTSDALAAYDEVASRLRREGRERDALDIFKKVVELDPQNPIAHLRIADSRARLGETDKAVDRFAEASRIMMRLGRKDDALKVLERLLEYKADPAYARMAGQMYLERGQPNDGMAALSKLQIAFKSNPKDLKTLAMLATAFDAIDQPKKAIEVLKESARVAREANNSDHFDQLLAVLKQRAPNDAAVKQMAQQARPSVAPAPSTQSPDVQVEILGEEEVLLDDSIDEVFELDDADIQHVEVSAADSGMFEAVEDDEPSGVRRLINEAERQRASGALQQAVGLLRDGLRNLGGSHQLRHKLSDLLLEAGDQPGSITEKLILAQELANEGSVEPALEMLDEVLLLQPDQPDAVQMRTNLGFPPDMALAEHQGITDLQLDAPLQSYDIESGGVEEVLHRSHQQSTPQIDLDDPFAGASQPAATPAAHQAPPAAQRTLDENALDRAETLAEQGRYDEARSLLHQQLQMLPNHPLVLDRLADIDALAAMAQSHASSGAYPMHAGPASQPIPLHSEPPSQAAISAQPYSAQPYSAQPDSAQPQSPQPDSAQPGSAQPYSPQPDSAQPGSAQPYSPQPGAAQPYSPQPGAAQPYTPQPQSAQPQPAGGYQAPPPRLPHESEAQLEPLMEQVRAGVKAQVSDADAATHYDLGVAYMEMGLHSDAISELTLAARDPARACVCLSIIGTIHLQHLGDMDAALDAMHRALNAPQKTNEQEMRVGYEIASTYELKGMPQQALQYFEWLAKLDATYQDPRGSVSERITHLRTESGAQRRPQAPAATPDAGELDDALDDLFGEGT